MKDPQQLAIVAAIIKEGRQTRRALWSINSPDYDYEEITNKEALEQADQLFADADQFVRGKLE